jgi:hypothetical protein
MDIEDRQKNTDQERRSPDVFVEFEFFDVDDLAVGGGYDESGASRHDAVRIAKKPDDAQAEKPGNNRQPRDEPAGDSGRKKKTLLRSATAQ